MEDRGLADAGASLRIRVHLELQPQSSGDLHLRRQTKQPGSFEALDAPEVDRVPNPEIVGVAPSTPQPDAAAEGVEHAAQGPEPVGGIPSRRPSDALDRVERGGDRGIHADRSRGDHPPAE
jgi:hypothetical protein